MDRTPQTLTDDERAGITWRVSSLSGNGGGDCVEAGALADGSGRVAVRHSQHPDGATIVFSPTEWAAFVGGVLNREFDFDLTTI